MDDQDSNNGKGRDFICACGKNYLSYAALFTHIKQKHDGKAPGPIVRPRSQRKRGRPRKNPQNSHESVQQDSQEEKDIILNSPQSLKYKQYNNLNPLQKKQEKTRQAAEILGCGEFQAFQAYNPENSLFGESIEKKVIIPKQIEEIKKSVDEEREILKQEENKEIEEEVKENYTLQEGCVRQIVAELQNIFRNKSCDSTDNVENESLQMISSKFNEFHAMVERNDHKIPRISQAIDEYYKTIIIKKIEHKSNILQYKSMLWLILQYLMNEKGMDYPNDIQFTELNGSILEFIEISLPRMIKEYNLYDLTLYKGENPTRFFICLCNWMGIKQSKFKYHECTEAQQIIKQQKY